MISYKGFRVYYVDPTTHDELQYAGTFEFCITSKTGTISMGGNYQEKDAVLAKLTSCGVDYNNMGGMIQWNTNYPDRVDVLRQVLPLTPQLAINETGQACHLKLAGSNGYAISKTGAGTVANGQAYISGAPNFALYDENDNYIGDYTWFFGTSQTAVTFLGVQNFDGELVQGTYEAVELATSSTPKWVMNGYNVYINTAIANWFNGIEPSPPEVTDPFVEGGTTEGTGGASGGSGGGDFDHTSDPIDFPSLPTLSAADAGFITLFNPTSTQLYNLANYMWSNPLFDLDAWKKIFADPMDAILGLSIVPVNVPSSGASAVTVGNISTGVSMNKASAQYVEVDCGSLNVKEFWGAYLDYSPYTKCEIHLPYCGIHPIDIDDIMGKTVQVKYHVDILSGACCAYVKCGDSVLYEFVGQCAASIPITGDNWTNVINGVMQIAASVGSMVATGGLAAPVTGANAAASIGQAVAIDANIASTIMSMKPSIEKSGSLGGVGGMLAIQKPYLILTRPKQALPVNQNKYTGYPSFITFVLSDLVGYTEIEQIHLENVPATSAELDEIIKLLKGGVIL